MSRGVLEKYISNRIHWTNFKLSPADPSISETASGYLEEHKLYTHGTVQPCDARFVRTQRERERESSLQKLNQMTNNHRDNTHAP